MRLTSKNGWRSPLDSDMINAIYNKLAAYEDAEEQERLLILPCKIGDMVYYKRGRDILGDTVEQIVINGVDNQVIVGAHKVFTFWDFGKNVVFLTREEAEAALKGESDE